MVAHYGQPQLSCHADPADGRRTKASVAIMALTSPASSTNSARRVSPSSTGLQSGRLVAHVLVLELFAVAPLVPWWADFQSRYEIALIFSFVTLCVVGAALGTYKGLRPLILIASVFPYCWLAVPASYQIAFRVAAWRDGTVTSQVGATEKALLICCCFQLLLLVGYVTPRRTGPRVPDGPRRDVGSTTDPPDGGHRRTPWSRPLSCCRWWSRSWAGWVPSSRPGPG